MRMVCFFTEYINFCVDILSWMYPHLDPSSGNIFDKLVHAFLHILVVLGFLNIMLYVVEKFIQSFIDIGREKQPLL